MNRSNGIAMAIACLALVTATTGTTYAVTTASPVSIVDADSPANTAVVDHTGHLLVKGPMSTIQSLTYAYSSQISGMVPVTSPSTATLAVTAIAYNNGRNHGTANLDYIAQFAKVTVGSSGNCSDSDATTTIVREDYLGAGTSNSVTYPYPLQFKPTAGKAYCLAVKMVELENVIGVTQYPVGITVDAFVTGGFYSGVGTGLARAHALAPRVVTEQMARRSHRKT